MSSITARISLQWDLWLEKFRAFFPSEKDDLEAGEDLLREASRSGRPEAPFGEQGSRSHPVRWAACQDTRTGRIIACLQISDLLPPGKKGKAESTLFPVEEMPLALQEKVAEGRHFTLLPDFHKSMASTVLLCHCVVEVLKAGGKGLVIPCALEHYSAFKRVGFRPIGTLQQTKNGQHVIPMICLPDADYLSIIHSPLLPYLRELDFDSYKDIIEWYYRLVRENKALQTGSAFYSEDKKEVGQTPSITEGLSKQGREAFLRDAMVVKCRANEVLINENDGGRSFGYVRKGLVQVVIGGKTVISLGEDDIFGEIAFILQTPRTAKVVAASPDTEVVLFNESAVDRLHTESDRRVIWQNLARVLAQRLVMTNNLLDHQ